MSETTITVSTGAGGDIPLGSFIRTSDADRFLVTEISGNTAFTVLWMRWWHEVMMWNPCNSLIDMYNSEGR